MRPMRRYSPPDGSRRQHRRGLVHLKSLTLRGFKSFASATTLRLEPGITCVVGPNGSGKSNIVDALSWVMGEQGAKSLRGGKMEDVVFAGTTSRPPLGRAEVTLTIDNTDGALPIDYSEVTLSRLMFRSGQSEYAINGNHCRLLDVQELLSDSGLGREMHVIVGQGQLDQVLHAGPEARRALIEEAAGVLKHRRRKEKALRKLEAMQANLTRLVDLTAELKRRLKPLGRQAEIARKAAVIQAELRDARLRLLADDYMTLHAALDREEAGEALVTERRDATAAALEHARRQEAELEAAAAQDAPRLANARDTWFGLSALAERLRGVAALAAERHRHLTADETQVKSGRPKPGSPPGLTLTAPVSPPPSRNVRPRSPRSPWSNGGSKRQPKGRPSMPAGPPPFASRPRLAAAMPMRQPKRSGGLGLRPRRRRRGPSAHGQNTQSLNGMWPGGPATTPTWRKRTNRPKRPQPTPCSE